MISSFVGFFYLQILVKILIGFEIITYERMLSESKTMSELKLETSFLVQHQNLNFLYKILYLIEC